MNKVSQMMIVTLLAVSVAAGCDDEIPNYLQRADSPADCSPPDSFHVTLRYRDPRNDCAELEPEFIGCMPSVAEPDLAPGSGASDNVPTPVCATRNNGVVICAYSHFEAPFRVEGRLEDSDVQGTWLWLRNAIARGVLDGAGSRKAPRRFSADEKRCFPGILKGF